MNEKKRIEKQINQIELQLKKLVQNVKQTEVSEDLQNSLILKKAVLKKELELYGKNIFIDKIKKLLPRKKKLICDYFN